MTSRVSACAHRRLGLRVAVPVELAVPAQNSATNPASYPLPFWVTIAGDRGRVAQREPPADRGAVVLDVDRVAGRRRGAAEQAGGQLGERVERVVELVGGGRVGQAEAEVVRSDHVVPVGQQRDQVRGT